MGLDLLPDKIGVWFENVAARDVVVVDQTCLDNYLRIPFGEIRNFVSCYFE